MKKYFLKEGVTNEQLKAQGFTVWVDMAFIESDVLSEELYIHLADYAYLLGLEPKRIYYNSNTMPEDVAQVDVQFLIDAGLVEERE